MQAGNVLLVEDSIEVRDLVAGILTHNGYTVSISCDGFNAWEMMTSNYFDLVISDLGLPGLDGKELLKNMRKNSIETPVLLISGVKIGENSDLDVISNCRLIHKPFEINEIKNAVSSLLNKK